MTASVPTENEMGTLTIEGEEDRRKQKRKRLPQVRRTKKIVAPQSQAAKDSSDFYMQKKK